MVVQNLRGLASRSVFFKFAGDECQKNVSLMKDRRDVMERKQDRRLPLPPSVWFSAPSKIQTAF